ncbi:hypothetical protein FBPa45_0080 [Pseudomonas phage vB_PaeS_FBPa45]|uniref:Uncharacterized protein n=1 Tax=Pseudomonas phage PA_L9 TaxID=3232177 RepID=A0AAU8L036_9CAUD|nr:DNA adenine methyltransferase [Pseudomonas phage BHU-1]UGV19928.1 DNA adenine methyltransferase [Pseudomonas phage Pa BHU-15]UIW13632.1 DNA adenine methyltransferase [Pseudomonas phage Pa BHU-17]UVN14082.1 hypothetical protein FBPa45_0080 [Pseudomonas phage vB_PaeS_FBPa45]
MTTGHVDEPNYLLQTLLPLRNGQTAKLVQVTKSRHGKLAVERTTNTGILFAPGQLYGLDPRAVVISLLGRGSCVIFPGSRKGAGDLVRAGVAPSLAKALLETLTEVYGVNR